MDKPSVCLQSIENLYFWNRADGRRLGGTAFKGAVCYGDPGLWMENSGMMVTASRLSGHPCRWSHEGMSELVFMLHVRTEGEWHRYANWVVRLSAKTLKVTHISAGPVLNSDTFRVEGYVPGAVVVASYHIIKSSARDGCSDILRLFLGEGDAYSAVEDICMSDIAWWPVQANASTPIKTIEGLRKWWAQNVNKSDLKAISSV